jgi:hypothetical protein
MTIEALATAPLEYGARGTDRIDVMDEHGVRIGWVDPRTGVRNLLAPDRAADFDEMIDFWLAAAGLSDEELPTASIDVPDSPISMRVSEVRYPDPEVVRSLVIPLLHLR